MELLLTRIRKLFCQSILQVLGKYSCVVWCRICRTNPDEYCEATSVADYRELHSYDNQLYQCLEDFWYMYSLCKRVLKFASDGASLLLYDSNSIIIREKTRKLCSFTASEVG